VPRAWREDHLVVGSRMSRELLAEHTLGDTLVRYPLDPASGRVGLEIVPAAAVGLMVVPRASLRGESFIDSLPGNDSWPARPVDSLLQFKLVGDPYPGAFAQGHTMRNSATLERFAFREQVVETAEGTTTIRTVLADDTGLVAEHVLEWRAGDDAFTIRSRIINGSTGPIRLEMLASFSLGGITPFHESDAPGRLRVHRFRSAWSAECRHECRTIEDLHLERSWSGAGAFSERFGQVGSMPVRKWFPFVAVEDAVAGVVWGARIAWAGSWQMEVFRQHDDVCLSGGLADREFGHWMKVLQAGEVLESPSAHVTCVRGGIDELCDRLNAMQEVGVLGQPAVEDDLPVVVNEWCTTWGDPSHANLMAIADRLAGTGVRYLVIDAGWYKQDGTDWSSGHGDWNPSPQLFPEGLKATADAIRARGLIPGLWFEMETVGSQSTAFGLGRHFLTRDGLPITVRERRFWDLNDPAAVAYLTEKVIDLLESCGFGYLKVDYNETFGIGCDHPDSLGEGLRLQTEGVYRFFERIRERLPELVIENCSSGGHRLEASMLGLAAMSSFSDAHELPEIPIIAANLHRLIQPRRSQIWAVLHPADSIQRTRYSLAATFLGRMCLSGAIDRLPGGAWDLACEAVALYRKCVSVIRDGTSRTFGEVGPGWRHPRGWQAVLRRGGELQLLVVHTFGGSPERIVIPGLGDSVVLEGFTDGELSMETDGWVLRPDGDFTGSVFLMSGGTSTGS
jgi:alpha-galactosidase